MYKTATKSFVPVIPILLLLLLYFPRKKLRMPFLFTLHNLYLNQSLILVQSLDSLHLAYVSATDSHLVSPMSRLSFRFVPLLQNHMSLFSVTLHNLQDLKKPELSIDVQSLA